MRGYFFKALDGEKFVTTSVIFAGKVITASFTPSQLQAGDPGFDPCTQRGSGKLYIFDLKTGVGEYTDAPATSSATRASARACRPIRRSRSASAAKTTRS